MRACAFFPPSLHPILDRGKGNKHPVVTPQVPAGGTVRQAIFDDKPYRQIRSRDACTDSPVVPDQSVRIEVLLTFRTVMLRIRDHDHADTRGRDSPSRAASDGPACRDRLSNHSVDRVAAYGIATIGDDLWRWQVSGTVIPSVGSGRYAPGPNMAVSSLFACWGQHYTTNAPQEPYKTR